MDFSGLSLVVPVYNEAENIYTLLDAVATNLGPDAEVLICYDSEEDTTLPPVRERMGAMPNIRLIRNEYGSGALGAIKSGFRASGRPAVVVAMGDLSDDLTCVPAMYQRFQEGCKVVAGSRYMRGGRQIGGPLLKRTMSRLAGISLYRLARIGTHDATNSFRLYARELLERVEIESDGGFELGIELTAKAHAMGLRVGEVPTTWTDRTTGQSRFRLWQWLPKYLRWYLYALRHCRDRGQDPQTLGG